MSERHSKGRPLPLVVDNYFHLSWHASIELITLIYSEIVEDVKYMFP